MSDSPRLWVGIDVGKTHHHACAIDVSGSVIWSQKLSNDQDAVENLIDVASEAGPVR